MSLVTKCFNLAGVWLREPISERRPVHSTALVDLCIQLEFQERSWRQVRPRVAFRACTALIHVTRRQRESQWRSWRILWRRSTLTRNGSGSRGWRKFICATGHLISIIFLNIYSWRVCTSITHTIAVRGRIVFGFTFEGRWFWWFFFVASCTTAFCRSLSRFFLTLNLSPFGSPVLEPDLELKINFTSLNDLSHLICTNSMIWDLNLLSDYDYFDGWFAFWDG